MDILRDEMIKARKEHTCEFCGQKIKKGETYHSQVNTSHEIYTFRTHKKCQEISLELDMYDDLNDEGLNDEGFWYCIDEAFMELKNIRHLDGTSKENRLDYVCNHYLKPKA